MDSLDRLYSEHLRVMKSRTDAAMKAEGFEIFVAHSGIAPTLFLDDSDYPFKANPHFKAWVPIIDNPHCLLVYRPSDRPHLMFYSPADYWYRPAELPTAPWVSEFDLRRVADSTELSKQLAALAGKGRVAAIGMPGSFAETAGVAVNPVGLMTRLHFDRAVKTNYELDCMRRASELAARGHRAAERAFRERASEYQAHMQYLLACAQREEEMPYNNIVAYNENASVLHYQHLARRTPERLRSFLLDAGAQHRGYAADITRTYAAEPGLYAELVMHLDAAQLKLCTEVLAGRDYRDIHLSAHQHIGEILSELGIVKIPGGDAALTGLTSTFFPHGIGHLLGLQVHDIGGLQASAAGGEIPRPEGHPYLRLTRKLEPGVVVTIEPGIYFIELLLRQARNDERRKLIDWTRVEELLPCGGVRIEDNVVATQGAPLNLTRAAFAALPPA